LPPQFAQEKLFDGTRVVVGRKGHPLAGARSLRQLVGAKWATSSITFKAEEEFRELFAQYGLPAPQLALRAQSAFSLITALANTDFLAMLPVQFLTVAESPSLLNRYHRPASSPCHDRRRNTTASSTAVGGDVAYRVFVGEAHALPATNERRRGAPHHW
jgi:DNA-binding transcriptional LysR family regulator